MTRPYQVCQVCRPPLPAPQPTRVTGPECPFILISSESLCAPAAPLHHLSMLVVPTLILPRDEELEVLGRTVEKTLGRSVQSIDVVGRGMSSHLTPLRN